MVKNKNKTELRINTFQDVCARASYFILGSKYVCMYIHTYLYPSIYLYLFIIFLVQCKHSIKIETVWHGGKGADSYLHWLVLVWTTHLACDFMLGGGVCQDELTLLQKVTKTKIIITVNLENTFRNIF